MNEIKKRAKLSCIFYGAPYHSKPKKGPYCTLTTYEECNPDTCPWYKSQEMLDESYERARMNYMKTHGGKDEYYKRGYGPKFRRLPQTED